jgi:TolB protein
VTGQRRTAALRVVLCALGLLSVSGLVRAEELIRLTHDGHLKQRPAWSPDGTQLVFARHEGSTIFLYVLDVATGKEQRLTERKDPEYDAVFCPVDANRLLFAADHASPNQGDIDIDLFTRSDGSLQGIVSTQGSLSHEEWPAWSPDGTRIAFTSTRDGNQELYAADADGQNSVRLTSDPAIDAHPCWSPDGEWIVFASNRWEDLELARIRPDGTGLARLTHSAGLDDYPAYSPDGRSIAFTTNREGHFDIALLDVETGAVMLATNDTAIDNFPAWHPDGRLTFVSNREDGFDVYVRRAAVD